MEGVGAQNSTPEQQLKQHQEADLLSSVEDKLLVNESKDKENEAAGTASMETNPAKHEVGEGKDNDDFEENKNNDVQGNGKEKMSVEEEKDPTTLILRAVTHKEEGNDAFKNGDYNSACRAYRKGTNLIKGLNEGNTGDEQVKALLVNLQTNLSMTCLKQNKPKLSRDVASKALLIQQDHVKALFRRATAHRALGDFDLAKTDLKRALQKDPVNRDCKRALLSLQKDIERLHEKESAALQRAFSSKKGQSSSFLYDDKEQERIKKKEEKAEQKKQKEIAKEKQKRIWEEECVKLMVDDPGIKPPSFEDWEKEKQKQAKEEKKKRKEEESKLREAAKPKQTKPKNNHVIDDDDSDDDILTETDLRMMRGYKKTSDGRTTSYFSHEQTEEEKKLLGSIAPQRLDAPKRPDSTDNQDQSSSPTLIQNNDINAVNTNASSHLASAWNQAGTWEERDTTEWCREALKSRLLTAASKHSSNIKAIIKEVEDFTGDASVAVVTRGKKSYVFDFHCKLKYEIRMEGDDDEVLASGTLTLPDISSTTISEKDGSDLDIEIMGW
eukprot:CAMPEP_0197828222 /NCGR_PEP_ID=MMETSP1437-20131217/4853_1 /TAXON_ID=49252 ORGANISM="Eucampia antarctica, Strain CCMP1452" /NCGR_SAMPLE_ID=MMETSP1437 /ASSEMBLY_ACC=CAM_ASM_001096 /LENGTH=553 /DNA_ID=CAMNT_0043429387 /DNA_START=49 /DNA_END=1707 /DNA_ORIENTATION=-